MLLLVLLPVHMHLLLLGLARRVPATSDGGPTRLALNSSSATSTASFMQLGTGRKIPVQQKFDMKCLCSKEVTVPESGKIPVDIPIGKCAATEAAVSQACLACAPVRLHRQAAPTPPPTHAAQKRRLYRAKYMQGNGSIVQHVCERLQTQATTCNHKEICNN